MNGNSVCQNYVSSQVLQSGYDPAVDGSDRGESGTLGEIFMYGIQQAPVKALITGRSQPVPFSYDYSSKVFSTLISLHPQIRTRSPQPYKTQFLTSVASKL